MTREEARDEIKNLLDYIRGKKELKPIKTREDAEAEERKGVEALDMAIKALEQEPTRMIDKSNFSQEQYKADLQCAYDCGKSILDKIRAEIEQTVSRYSISRERGCMGQVEWSDRLIKESEVLQILDKYKAEEEKE